MSFININYTSLKTKDENLICCCELVFSQYPHRNIFGRGQLKAVLHGFIQLCKSVETYFFSYFIDLNVFFFNHINVYCCQIDGILPPLRTPPPRANLLSFASSIVSTCFWLVVVYKTSNSGHLRPPLILCSFFVAQFEGQNDGTDEAPGAPPWPCLCSDYWLVVASKNEMRAT